MTAIHQRGVRIRYVTVKTDLLFPFPQAVTTVMRPVVAPGGTVAVILVYEFTVKALFTPLSWTLVALAKAVPAMVTTVPTDPLVRVNCLTFGFTLKTESLVSEPVGVVTEMGPVSAPVGTDVSICESKTSEKAAGIPLNAIWVARRRSRVRQRPWLRLARRGTPGSRALTGPGRSLSPALSVRPRREPRCPIVVASSAPMAPTRISTNATGDPKPDADDRRRESHGDPHGGDEVDVHPLHLLIRGR